MSASKLLFRGSLLSGADQLVRAVAALVLAPIVITRLGVGDFGAWVLLSGLFSQFTLLDPGLSSSLPHFLSAPDARGDEKELRSVASTAFMTYLVITWVSVLLTAIIWLALPMMVNDPRLMSSCRMLTAALGAATCFGSLTRVFPMFLQSRLRRDVISVIGVTRVVVCNALIWWLLARHGAGLEMMGLVHAGGGIVESLVLVVCGRDLLPRIRPRWATKDMARRIMGFSGWSYLITTSERFRSGLDGFILGWLRGSPAAGLYSLGLRPVAMVSETVYACIGNQLLPTFSRLREASGREHLHDAFVIVTRLSAIVSAFCCCLVLVLGPPFLQWWVPGQAGLAIPVLLCLAIPYALQTAQVPAIHLLYALAEHRALALAQSAAVGLNLVLSCVLAWWLGLIGAAIGTAIDIAIIHGLVIPWLVARRCGIPMREFLGHAQAIPFVVCLATSILPLLAMFYWLPQTVSLTTLVLAGGGMTVWLAGWTLTLMPVRADLRALRQLTASLSPQPPMALPPKTSTSSKFANKRKNRSK